MLDWLECRSWGSVAVVKNPYFCSTSIIGFQRWRIRNSIRFELCGLEDFRLDSSEACGSLRAVDRGCHDSVFGGMTSVPPPLEIETVREGIG